MVFIDSRKLSLPTDMATRRQGILNLQGQANLIVMSETGVEPATQNILK